MQTNKLSLCRTACGHQGLQRGVHPQPRHGRSWLRSIHSKDAPKFFVTLVRQSHSATKLACWYNIQATMHKAGSRRGPGAGVASFLRSGSPRTGFACREVCMAFGSLLRGHSSDEVHSKLRPGRRNHVRDVLGERLRRRTPGPPPFSSMNSTPERSKAF
jgi:hypothetical protein